jgi:glutamate synthase domain-containing protein 2
MSRFSQSDPQGGRGVDLDGQVLECWLSATRELAAAEALLSPDDQHDRMHA